MKNTSTQRSHSRGRQQPLSWAAQNTLQKCVSWVGTSLRPPPSVKVLPELTRSLQIPWVLPHSHWAPRGSPGSRDGSFLCRRLSSQAESWLLSVLCAGEPCCQLPLRASLSTAACIQGHWSEPVATEGPGFPRSPLDIGTGRSLGLHGLP